MAYREDSGGVVSSSWALPGDQQRSPRISSKDFDGFAASSNKMASTNGAHLIHLASIPYIWLLNLPPMWESEDWDAFNVRLCTC